MKNLFYSDSPWVGAILFALLGVAAAGAVYLLRRLISRWNGEGFERTAEGKIVRVLAIVGIISSLLIGTFGCIVIMANLDYLRGEFHRSQEHHISAAQYLGRYAAAVTAGSLLKSFFLASIVNVPLRDVHMAVANAYLRLGEYEKGFESLKLACGSGAGEDIAYEAYANQLEAQGCLKLAVECYEKLARRRTNDVQSAYRAASCHLQLGDKDKAKDWARIYLARSGKPDATIQDIEEVFTRINQEAQTPR